MCASSWNIAMNSGSSVNCGCSRFTATSRLKPPSPTRRAGWTVAIPPRAIGGYSTYRPNGSSGAPEVGSIELVPESGAGAVAGVGVRLSDEREVDRIVGLSLGELNRAAVAPEVAILERAALGHAGAEDR